MKLSQIFNRAKESATKTISTIVQVANITLHVRRANVWRDAYNPLRGLNVRRVVSLLEAGERGAYAELQWTYRFIEKRDAVLRGGKRSLIAAVGGMDWEIRTVDEKKLPPGATKAMAEKQRDTLRAAYDRIDNLRQAIEHFCLAEFRGFALLEKCYAEGGQNDGAVTRLEPIEQWYLVRDGLNGEWQYNADARFGRTKGEEIPSGRVMVREVEDPINEIALIAFVRKNISQKDWDGYIESYGIPSIFAIMPQQVRPGEEDKYLEVAEKVIGNARGVLPNGADIKSIDNGARGVNPFRDHLRYQDEQIALAITSGLLTMLAESGSGTLAGGAHSETFDRIARGLAGRISESFQRQFDKEILELSHQGEPVLAYFAIAAEEETDTGEFITGVKELSLAGFAVSPGQIAEKTGYDVVPKATNPAPETNPGKPGELPVNAPVANRRVKNRSAVAGTLGVPDSWVTPIEDLLTEMESKVSDGNVSDAELLQFFKDTQARLPELLGDMDVEALSGVFESALGASVLEGVRETMKTSQSKQP
jgi:phage gp29-like protein